jgi:hypothetical protein
VRLHGFLLGCPEADLETSYTRMYRATLR